VKIDEPFTAHRRSLLESYSWRVLTVEARKVLDRIELEHLRHGGKENGSLIVSYSAFYEYGMPKYSRAIARAIQEAEALGLLRVVRGGFGKRGRGIPNRYRLTYLPTLNGPATDEWREIATMDDAKSRIAAVKKSRKPSAWFEAGKAAKALPRAS